MNNGNNNSASGGIGFIGLLTIVFIAFKLLKVIKWSWVWVLAPLWMSVALFVLIVFICCIIACVSE